MKMKPAPLRRAGFFAVYLSTAHSEKRRLFPRCVEKVAAAYAFLRRIGERDAALHAVLSVFRISRAENRFDALDVQFQKRLARHIAHKDGEYAIAKMCKHIARAELAADSVTEPHEKRFRTTLPQTFSKSP